MPIVSRFYGIVIRMYYNDHNPPHFHALYGGSEAIVEISDSDVIAGELPARARNLVVTWTDIHRGELEDNWRRMRDGEPPFPIDPLD